MEPTTSADLGICKRIKQFALNGQLRVSRKTHRVQLLQSLEPGLFILIVEYPIALEFSQCGLVGVITVFRCLSASKLMNFEKLARRIK